MQQAYSRDRDNKEEFMDSILMEKNKYLNQDLSKLCMMLSWKIFQLMFDLEAKLIYNKVGNKTQGLLCKRVEIHGVSFVKVHLEYEKLIRKVLKNHRKQENSNY